MIKILFPPFPSFLGCFLVLLPLFPSLGPHSSLPHLAAQLHQRRRPVFPFRPSSSLPAQTAPTQLLSPPLFSPAAASSKSRPSSASASPARRPSSTPPLFQPLTAGPACHPAPPSAPLAARFRNRRPPLPPIPNVAQRLRHRLLALREHAPPEPIPLGLKIPPFVTAFPHTEPQFLSPAAASRRPQAAPYCSVPPFSRLPRIVPPRWSSAAAGKSSVA